MSVEKSVRKRPGDGDSWKEARLRHRRGRAGQRGRQRAKVFHGFYSSSSIRSEPSESEILLAFFPYSRRDMRWLSSPGRPRTPPNSLANWTRPKRTPATSPTRTEFVRRSSASATTWVPSTSSCTARAPASRPRGHRVTSKSARKRTWRRPGRSTL